jgi:riboflavin kinase/FMN adenylyltransferase
MVHVCCLVFSGLKIQRPLKVYHSLEEFTKLPGAVVTTGTFDGVHIGHRRIIKRLQEVAERTQGQTVIFTFNPHPRLVLQPDMDLRLITTLEEKVELLREADLEHLIIYPFTREFSRTGSMQFVRNILVNSIGAKKLVIGYDHHFGRNREGSFEHLKEFGPVYGFDVEEIPAQDVDDVKVSSTKIREALAQGNVALANRYLQSHFMLSGFVVKGNRLGHQIGYPTANIELADEHKLVPADGVYAVRVKNLQNGHNHIGMCNIGQRPTVSGKGKTIEVHIFDFSADIYGDHLRLYFEQRVRNEERFSNLEALKHQLKSDEQTCRKLLE